MAKQADGVQLAAHPEVERMQAAVRTLLTGVGEDVKREGLLDTPKRVAKALLDASRGYHQTAAGVLGSAYFHEPIVHNGGEGLVLVRDIDFASTSEDTLLPFHGRCHIGYVPRNGVVLGLSKLARLTRMFAKRLQSQERLGREVATSLQRQLQCQGVAVVIQARHLTMSSAVPAQPITTACISGCFTHPSSSAFQEVLCMTGVEDVPPGSLLQLPDPCQDLQGVTRSDSNLSDVRCNGVAPTVCCGVQGPPLPPSTPDLSEHFSESDSHSLRGGPGSSKCDGSSDKGGQLSEHGSEKDLSDLASRGSDHDSSSEQDDDSDSLPQYPAPSHPSQPDRQQQQQQQHQLLSHRLAMHQPHQPHASRLGPLATPSTTTITTIPDAAGCQAEQQQQQQDHDGHDACNSSPPTPTAADVARCAPLPLPATAAGLAPYDPRRALSADAMERAAQALVTAMGECPHRPGLLGSARRYVMTLLSATSGYTRQLPEPLHAPSRRRSTTAPQSAGACPHQGAAAAISTGPQAGSACPCCQASTPPAQTCSEQQQPVPPTACIMTVHSTTTTPNTSSIPSACRHIKVPFTSQCEHHMLPFYGHVHVVYTPPPPPPPALEAVAGQPTAPQSEDVCTEAQVQEAVRQVVLMYTQRLQVQERITHQVADGVMSVLCPSSALVLVDAAHMCMVARGVENHAGHTTSVAVRGGAEGDAAWRARALALCRAAGLA